MSAIAKATQQQAEAIEAVLVQGDLSKLNPGERVQYYQKVCESLGLNPLTKPFEYLTLNGKTILYARRDCTEQLRKRDRVSVAIVAREVVEGVYVVTAKASTPDGRCDESVGAVSIDKLQGEARANAMMKAETKAKRRVTLSLCGLGMLDETEVGETPQMATAAVVVEQPKQLQAPAKPVEVKVTPSVFDKLSADVKKANSLEALQPAFAAFHTAWKSNQMTDQQYEEGVAVKNAKKEQFTKLSELKQQARDSDKPLLDDSGNPVLFGNEKPSTGVPH